MVNAVTPTGAAAAAAPDEVEDLTLLPGGTGAAAEDGSSRNRPEKLNSRTSIYGMVSLDPSSEAIPGQGGQFKFITSSGQMTAWNQFKLLDTDKSSTLDYNEVTKLAHTLNVAMSKRDIKEAFSAMDHDKDGEVSFNEFANWLKGVEEVERRKSRRLVRESFDRLDKNRDGHIGKTEFASLMDNKKLQKRMHLLPNNGGTAFNLDADWALMHRRVAMLGQPITDDLAVTFADFEAWWKDRNGIDDPDIPVLPEYMAKMANELSMDPKALLWKSKEAEALKDGLEPPKKTGLDLWDFLRPRLKMLVTMQSQWGDLRDIYESHTTSFFAYDPLPKWIRDPDSAFSGVWDISQLMLLFYVSFTVPYRVCFEIDVPFGSMWFWIDNLVDVYFIIDLGLNFRTAYYDEVRHKREDQPREIAIHYLKGWFIVDFLSCVPVQWVGYAVQGNTDDAAGDDLKAVKILRLARMTKMM